MYSASSRTRLRCANASRKSALISAIRATKHQHHTSRPRIRAGLSRDVPVYFPSFRRVLIPACHRGRAQAEYRPGCLVRSLSQSLRRSVATTIEPCSLLQKRVSKKVSLLITSADVDRFSQSFHRLIHKKSLYVCITKICTTLWAFV